MKKIILTIFAATLFLFNGIGQTVNVTVATVNGTSGQIALVPATVSGIDGDNGGTAIIGLNIDILYNTTIATFLDVTNLNAILTAAGTWNTSAVDNGTIHVDWQANDILVPVSVPDGQVLYECRFIGNASGTSPLTLNQVEFSDISGTILGNSLTNGSITFGAPVANTTWNGTGNWYTPANWSNGIPGKSTLVTIATGVVTIDGTTGYTGNMSINPGSGVTINTGKTLSVFGNLVLESDASQTATGALLRNGSLTVTGTTTVERYLTGGTQHFISIPVGSASVADLIDPSNTGYLFNFVESTNAWENPWETTYQLVPSNGYSVNYTSAETLALNGVLNNDGSYSPAVSRLGNGWNFVGNPYPCPLDWTLAAGWTKTNVDNATYVWNNSAYASYVNGVGVNGGSKYIPLFQGFFIHSSAGTPTFSIKKAARTHNGNDTLYMKNEVANLFRLSISNGSLGDETAVYMTSEATQNFDTEYDAYKLFGFNENAPHIYTRAGEVDFAINGQPVIESLSLPVIVKVSQDGTYTIEASGFESFDGFYFFILEDKESGMNYDLKQTSELTLEMYEGESIDRFTLRIFKSALGIGDDLLNSVRIYSENKAVYFENCPESRVEIYDLAGNTVAIKNFGESSLNMMTLDVPAGLYVVRVTASSGITTSKIFIK
jgi:hypothetical protein